MKSPAFWLGAITVAVVTSTTFWFARRPAAPYPEASIPLATPPGITLQIHKSNVKGRGAASSQVVYADTDGMTLYTSDKDGPGKSSCVGNCERVWPPAIAPPAAMQVGEWSLVNREDGKQQWAYRALPLYRYSQDTVNGDTKGESAEDGSWHVAAFRPDAGLVLPGAITVREISNAAGSGLVDNTGITLYTFGGDPLHLVPRCNDNDHCAQDWLPLEAPAVANPVGEFSVVTREDGIAQWSFRGNAIYRFNGDQGSGDANGVGLDARLKVAMVTRYFMPANATVRHNAELGDILATTSGLTLYQRDRAVPGEGHGFRADHSAPALGRFFGTKTCDAECAKTWPPFTAPTGALASGYWDIATRPDGTRQWVYKGFALYTYLADKPGDTSGYESYKLAQIGDPPIIPLASEDPNLNVGGAASGAGLAAMVWRPVVP